MILSTLSSIAQIEASKRDKPRLQRMTTKLRNVLYPQKPLGLREKKLDNQLRRLSTKRPTPSIQNLKTLSTKPKPVLERAGSAKLVRNLGKPVLERVGSAKLVRNLGKRVG
jgi:hypothetical protein